MSNPNHAQYVRDEAYKYHKQIRELDLLHVSVKQHNAKAFKYRLENNPDDIAEAVKQMIDGDFGFGCSLSIKEMIDGSVSGATLDKIICFAAATAWFCPLGAAQSALMSLDEYKRSILKGMVDVAVLNYRNDVSEGRTENFSAMKAGRKAVKL